MPGSATTDFGSKRSTFGTTASVITACSSFSPNRFDTMPEIR